MKFTPEIIQRAAAAIAAGKNRAQAAKAAGISRDTFNEWMSGEIPLAALKNCKNRDEEEKVKSVFSDAIKKAEETLFGVIRTEAIVEIRKAMKKNWTAAAWWLERTDPEFRQKTATDLTSKGQQFVFGLPPSPFATGQAKERWDRKYGDAAKKNIKQNKSD